MTAILGLVKKATKKRCRYCARLVVVVTVSGRDVAWSQTESHPCVKTALSDLVDAEVFGDGGVA